MSIAWHLERYNDSAERPRTHVEGDTLIYALGRIEPERAPEDAADKLVYAINEVILKDCEAKGIKVVRGVVYGYDKYYQDNLQEILSRANESCGLRLIASDVARFEADRPYVPVRPKDACMCKSCHKIGYKHSLNGIGGSYGRDTGVFFYTCQPCAEREGMLAQMWGPN